MHEHYFLKTQKAGAGLMQPSSVCAVRSPQTPLDEPEQVGFRIPIATPSRESLCCSISEQFARVLFASLKKSR
jgi:hypothetical protein